MAQHPIDYFEALVDARGEAEAVVFRSQQHPTLRLSFAELDARVNRAAHLLRALGVVRGDLVGCHMYDTPAHVDTMLAAWKLGAVPVNVNFRYVADELAYLFADAQPKVVVTEPELAESARAAAARLSAPPLVVVADGDHARRLERGPSARPELTRADDDLYVLYTGGTTGMPKGVMWRMADALFGCFGASAIASLGLPELSTPQLAVQAATDKSPAAQALARQCPLTPLMHGAGQWALGRTLVRGSTTVLIREPSFDPEFALRVLAEEEVGVVWAAGDAHARPVLDALRTNDEATAPLPKLRLWVSSAVMLSATSKAELSRALPAAFVLDGLGASESGGQGQAVGYDAEGSPRFAVGDDAVILDGDMRPIPRDERRIGKLAKTGRIPLGYRNDPDKTAQTFPVIDGVRYSVPGDLARWEPDGTITLFGRGSVSINTGGEKVHPEEVEKALKTHPAILDALVVGTPDERLGKRVTAIVSLRPGHADPGLQRLAEHCHGLLAGYKAPRALVVCDEVVRSPSGKPDYRWAANVAARALTP